MKPIGNETKEMGLAEIHDWVFSELGFCGCGDPESAVEFLRDTLNLLATGCQQRFEEMKSRFPETPMAWTYLYMLDDKGLTEHGTSIRGCWLTNKGKTIQAALNTYSPEQIVEGVGDDDVVLSSPVIEA